jgi:uncharacterized membrane protein YgcG
LVSALLAALAALWAVVAVVPPAQAVEPLELQKQITDRADVLDENEQMQVRRALDHFYERTGLRLHVVYVESFAGLGPQQWTGETANKSGLGKNEVLLAFARKNRAFGHVTANPDLSKTALQAVDVQRIEPALRNDDYAKATIDAADAYGDIAEDAALPWAWIVAGLAVAGLALWIIVLRARRRFDHTHHVLDEHGRPVDPAQILTLSEIDATSAAALIAVDDALLTAADDVGRAAEQLGAERVAEFKAIVDAGRVKLDEAFAVRHKLDKLIARGRPDEEAERKWRKRASRIIKLCEAVDASLDARTEEYDDLRGLRKAADARLAALTDEVERVAARVPAVREVFAELSTRASWPVTGNVDLAGNLLDGAEGQLSRRDHAATRVRVIEDAASTAARLLDAVSEAAARPERVSASALLSDVERYVASRRGAVGVEARTLRSEAKRHLQIAESTDDPEVADSRLSSAAADAQRGLEAAIADVTNWLASREAHDEKHGRKFDALVLAGILVDETESGGLRTLLGGSSHGGGSGAPYRGVESGGTQRTAGSFGGTTTRGRHGGFSYSSAPAKMTP